MIFAVRQLVEKTLEHNDSLLVLFVDLKKAYDSVPRSEVYHNRCVRTILGVTRYKQWSDRITTRQLSAEFGMERTIKDILRSNRLRWLGHLACMEDNRMPKQLLFGELKKTRPTHGTKK